MKKVFSIMAVAVILLGAQSCAKKCVKCTVVGLAVKTCESDYDASKNGGATWEQFKSNAIKSGCTEE